MRLAHMTWPQAGEYFKKNDIILLSVATASTCPWAPTR